MLKIKCRLRVAFFTMSCVSTARHKTVNKYIGVAKTAMVTRTEYMAISNLVTLPCLIAMLITAK